MKVFKKTYVKLSTRVTPGSHASCPGVDQGIFSHQDKQNVDHGLIGAYNN